VQEDQRPALAVKLVVDLLILANDGEAHAARMYRKAAALWRRISGMSSLKEIEERQQRMYKLIDQMTSQEDMTLMLQVVQQLEKEANELQAAALSFQEKMEKMYGKSQTGAFEVVLTAEQRQRVLKETGVDMASVWIEDLGGARNAAMPMTRRDEIEAEALRQARALKEEQPAREAAQREIEEAMAEIEAAGPLHAELLAQVKQDPRFRDALDVNKKIR
jgi:ribosomal protein L18E